MAISKILYIGDSGSYFHGKHLKQALNYICDREKTGGGAYVAGHNCQAESVYGRMMKTKEKFGKTDKRQAYHLIISFKENEVDAETAFEIMGKFVTEYLGKEYEALYTVHDNTAHIHGHIIFNSVSCMSGRKFRYEIGDWEKYIQPLTNRLCEEYGLSLIEISDESKEKREPMWKEYRNGAFVWSDMIGRDLDACILQASTYDSFLTLLSQKGYEIRQQIKEGESLAIKPPGMGSFRWCKSLGEMYTDETICRRIATENLAHYQKQPDMIHSKIVTCHVRRFRRAKLTGIQKKYFAKLYRIGKLKKCSYSQAWKYKDEIRKMGKLQEQYLFLAKHDIIHQSGLIVTEESLTEQKKELLKEKSQLYRKQVKYTALFESLRQLEDLAEAEQSYQAGDSFFLREHKTYLSLQESIQQEGYGISELQQLRQHFIENNQRIRRKEKMLRKELSLAKSIRKELTEQAKHNQTITASRKEIKKKDSQEEKQQGR